MELVVVTRSTLKTLWFAGGGLLATWFAVTPTDSPSTRLTTSAIARSVESRSQPTDELNAQEAQLRRHLEVLPPRPSARNPFRFGSSKSAARPLAAEPGVEARPADAPVPLEPALRLSGIAEQKSGESTIRTAVISGDGQLYLVREGEAVAGRYRVVTIDSDAVTLGDDSGGQLRLALH
jgi:hypothetical protein